MDLSDRRARTSPVLGAARTGTDWCRLLHTRPAALAEGWSEMLAGRVRHRRRDPPTTAS